MLIYGDNLDATPHQPYVTSNTYLLDSTKRWALGLEEITGPSNTPGAFRGHVIIQDGAMSDRHLRISIYSGSSSSNYYTIQGIGIPVNNPLAKHVIGAAFSWSLKPGSSDTESGDQNFARPLIAWNGGLTISNQTGSSQINKWGNTALMLVGGKFQLAGVQSADPVPLNSFMYLELELDPVAGTASLFIDGDPVLGLQNVPIPGLTAINAVGMVMGYVRQTLASTTQPNATYLFDNIYVLDDTGADFNDRLGPVSFKRLPLLAQTTTAFTPVGAPSNIDAVNKTTLDEATYNESPLTNNVGDMYTLDTSSLSPTGEILGVVTNIYARKTDVGARKLASVIKENSATISETMPELLMDFNGSQVIAPSAPDGTAWTSAKLAAATAGYEVKP